MCSNKKRCFLGLCRFRVFVALGLSGVIEIKVFTFNAMVYSPAWQLNTISPLRNKPWENERPLAVLAVHVVFACVCECVCANVEIRRIVSILLK
jgi:hypothetical protein